MLRTMPEASRRSGRTARRLVVLAALLTLTATAAGAQSEQPPPRKPGNLGYQGVDPGKPVAFDLATGRILEVLPFDVQFYLQSPVDDKVARVSGRYLQYRKLPEGEGCNDVFPAPPAPPRGYLAPMVMVVRDGTRVAMGRTLAGPRDARTEEVRRRATEPATRERQKPRAERRLGERRVAFVRFYEEAPSGGGAAVRKVELSVPELKPNRIICFEFDLAKKVDPEAFWGRALAEVDGELRGIERDMEATPEAYNLLRRRLLRSILESLGPGERLAAPAGSFFDPYVNLAGVLDSHLARFVAIVGAQDDKWRGIDSGQEGRDELVAALLQLVKADAYAKLATSALALEVLGGRARVLQITADGVGEVADGRPSGAPELDLRAVWVPTQLDPPITQLEETRTDLEALERVVKRWFQDRPGVAESEGLEAQALDQLADRLDEALGALEFRLSDLGELRRVLDERQQGAEELVRMLMIELAEKVRILGTSVGDYETRAAWYVSADVGAGFAPDIDEMFTYVGTNIYFRPVNKKAPLRGLDFWKRFSLMVGITNEALARDGQFQGLIGTSPILVSGGLRLNDHLRLSAGAVVFRDTDPNPLIETTRLAWSPYVSLSIDWNLRKLFSNFGGAFNQPD